MAGHVPLKLTACHPPPARPPPQCRTCCGQAASKGMCGDRAPCNHGRHTTTPWPSAGHGASHIGATMRAACQGVLIAQRRPASCSRAEQDVLMHSTGCHVAAPQTGRDSPASDASVGSAASSPTNCVRQEHGGRDEPLTCDAIEMQDWPDGAENTAPRPPGGAGEATAHGGTQFLVTRPLRAHLMTCICLMHVGQQYTTTATRSLHPNAIQHPGQSFDLDHPCCAPAFSPSDRSMTSSNVAAGACEDEEDNRHDAENHADYLRPASHGTASGMGCAAASPPGLSTPCGLSAL